MQKWGCFMVLGVHPKAQSPPKQAALAQTPKSLTSDCCPLGPHLEAGDSGRDSGGHQEKNPFLATGLQRLWNRPLSSLHVPR